jgi:hypothetical protein
VQSLVSGDEECRQQLRACDDHPIRRILVQISQLDGTQADRRINGQEA